MSEEIRVKGKLLKITNNGNFMMPPVRGDEVEVELSVTAEELNANIANLLNAHGLCGSWNDRFGIAKDIINLLFGILD